jgi:hypothetical protein
MQTHHLSLRMSASMDMWLALRYNASYAQCFRVASQGASIVQRTYRSSYLPISLNVEWTIVTHVHIANSGLNAFLKTVQVLASKATLTNLSVHDLTDFRHHQQILSLTGLPTVRQFSIGGPNAQNTCKLLLGSIKLPFFQTFCVDNGSITIVSADQLPMNTLKLLSGVLRFPWSN